MSNLELRSRLYAWLGNRTSKVDGDAHDHESLLTASRDLAALVASTTDAVMTAPELSPAERDVVARFDAAPALPESWEAAVPDPRFRDQLAEALREIHDDGRDWKWLADALLPVVAAEVEARTRTAAAQKAAEELDAMAVAFYADARHLVSTGEEAYRHAADDCRARAAALTQPDGQP